MGKCLCLAFRKGLRHYENSTYCFMITVQDIQVAIEKLPEEDYDRLREWLSEREEKAWDQQIEEGSRSGNFDFLLNEAKADKVAGRLRKL